jgi:hypothetical protein
MVSAQGRTRATWWTLLLLVALGALVLAAPASAGERQSADISQSCNAGDSGSDSDGGSGSSNDDSDSGGNCSNQDRVVQQSGGGDVSRSINQRQSFGDDDRGRSRRDNDDRGQDEEDFETSEDTSVETTSECGDFSSQADAQAALEENPDDSELDDDGDGRACEEEFTQEVSGAPEGGIETGGGGTLARAETAPDALSQVARFAGPPLALALVAAGLLGLRRGRST